MAKGQMRSNKEKKKPKQDKNKKEKGGGPAPSPFAGRPPPLTDWPEPGPRLSVDYVRRHHD